MNDWLLLDRITLVRTMQSKIKQSIMRLYRDFYPKLKEIEIAQAIELLKAEGYKILKRVENVQYEET